MRVMKKITDGIAKAAEIVCMAAIAALVVIIVTELARRNFFNSSYRGSIELCGIAFLWMAFIGLIPLYNNSGLMRLDFLITRTKGGVFEALYFVNKIFSLLLGIVMVIAFIAQYPYVNTRYYSTFAAKIPYTVQYFPMCLAGAFMAVKSVEQLIEEVMKLSGKEKKEENI